MWHTDYKQLDEKRWFISYEDDASRYVTGWGVFNEATTKHAIEVLDRAITKHGKPKSILSDRGSQFYATESEKKSKGESKFERHLGDLGIQHILCRVAHPQTNTSWSVYTASYNASCVCSKTWPGHRAVLVRLTRLAQRRIP